jgi:hypothetical protein
LSCWKVALATRKKRRLAEDRYLLVLAKTTEKLAPTLSVILIRLRRVGLYLGKGLLLSRRGFLTGFFLVKGGFFGDFYLGWF